ncbi:MAG: S9 family peptidase [Phycisphaerales bacterium]|nr:S9 family peptidase [Phycisphaerales bacterium]MCB9836221.1 S9 family peptidase [Phycisphaera sp.]
MRTLLVGLALTLPLGLSAQPGDDTHGITLELIMSDPEWIGLFPENAYWSDDGERVIFSRRRAGSSLSDLIEIDPVTQEEQVLSDAERSAMARADWVYDRDRTRRVCSRGGDLWLGDVATGEVRQLTRTSAREGSARFMSDPTRITYESGGQWYIMDLDDFAVWQVADVRLEDEPKAEEDGKDYLDQQQERLFTTIVERQDRDEQRKQQREAIEEADASAVPGPFYLGKGLERRGWSLSDDGRFLAVIAAKPAPDAKRDVMPSYVTEDGYVNTSRVRAKVGVGEEANERLFVLDLESETWSEVDLSNLPGIKDDPLAFLKSKKDDDTESKEGTNKEDEDKGDEEHKPRGVDLRGLAWRPGGGGLVVQAWSHDHKDRWIVGIGPDEKPDAVSIFRESSEAWINWRVGSAGWTSDGAAYWFLSEASGYAHVHVWDGDAIRQVTSGSFEVWDVAESAKPGVLYARTNAPDPSIYDFARITLGDDRLEILTDFGAAVDRFQLNDDGSRVAMEVSSTDHPAELFVMPTDGSAEPIQITHSVTKAFTQLPLIKPEYADVPCRDGRTIRARVYDFDGGGQQGFKPAVIFVHGAGYTQNVHRGWPYYFREMMFHSLLAYKGYVVADIDYRASAGYGRDFRTAIYRHMGGPEIEDMVDTAKWMSSERGVDASRIGTYGGSYGGFLAIMAVFKEPGVFAAGAALRPVTDWAHYNQGYTSAILNTPEKDPQAYEQSSPIEFAEGFEGGLLICHGVLDDNVLVQDSIRLQQRLIELGKQDWEVALYPLESHGFIEPSAWLDEYRRIFRLFETRLRRSAPE